LVAYACRLKAVNGEWDWSILGETMNIGIIASGNMGASMGKAWAKKGHKVVFTFSRNQDNLRAVADAAGHNARTGTPRRRRLSGT
jgi:6-phosphogluconate dehydrogenase (decarboxylating)